MEKIVLKMLSHDDVYYHLCDVLGNEVVVPIHTMRYVTYPDKMLENSFIKNGEEVSMVKVGKDDGKIWYYPDHSVYAVIKDKKQVPEASGNVVPKKSSVESVYKLDMLLKEYYKKSSSLSPAVQINVLKTISTGDEDASCSVLRKVLGFKTFDHEDEYNEYKSSFLYPALSSDGKLEEKNMQLKVIAKELVGFANTGHEGYLYVGVSDDGEVTGIENEISIVSPDCDCNKFSTMFKNIIKQCTSAQFMMSLDIKWIRMDSHLICRIYVPAWNNGIVLYSGEQLFVRHDSSNIHLKGNDLINYIINRKEKNGIQFS